MASSIFPSSGVRSTTTTITAAQLATMADTPMTLVPGIPGSLLMGVSVVGQTVPGTVPFTGAAPTFTVTGGVSGGASLLDLSTTSGTAGYNAVVFPNNDGTTASADGDPLIITASSNPTVTGAILTSSLDGGGSGYAEGDTGTVDGGNGNATYVVDTVDGGGAIVTYTITNGGTGYVPSGQNLTATTGGGSLAAITIESIASLVDLDATFTVAYYVVPVG